MTRLPRLLTALLFGLTGWGAWAAEDILIGQTADLSSVAGQQMKEFNAGALAYFSLVNAKGGVKGRPIKLQSLDDAFSAEKAAVNAKKLIDQPAVLALFGTRGTDPSEAVMKLADANRVALVGPVTGADSTRESAFTYPVRASYRDEVEKMLEHLSFVPARLALVVQDDKFGNPLAAFIESQLKQTYRTTTVVAKVKFPRKKPDLSAEAAQILNTEPNAVIALCNPTSCESLVRHLHDQAKAKAKPRPTVYQTSISDMYTQYKKLGPEVVAGHPYTQVLPDPNRGVSAMVREYRAAMLKANAPLTYRTYEGYVSAAVMAEALRRAPSLTREGVAQALEQGMTNPVEFGEVSVRYAARNHRGSAFVDLVTIDRQGRLVH
jgi:branched-chain amino acid transport system substrate-binding protein